MKKTYKYYPYLYITLFILLIVYPHIIQGHILRNMAMIQSITNFMIVGIWISIYFIWEYRVSKIEKEKDEKDNLLVDNYQYIAWINANVWLIQELMKNLESQKKTKFSKQYIIKKLKHINNLFKKSV